MYLHFKTIAEKVDLPVILYNVPGRTVADMGNETILRLAKVPGIVGVKDATGNLERGMQLIAGLNAAGCADFAVYSGDDLTALLLMLMGGHGNISVTANVAPRLMHELCLAAIAGDSSKAKEIQYKLLAVHKSMFIEANPIPVKWALHAMGLMASGIRLPLTTLTAGAQEQVLIALKDAGLIKK
jgi:4-hydroxy-tetrahydrodipicolinate synthase